MVGARKGPIKLRVKMSKIQFPEICPVCLEEAEDLVFVTIMEKSHSDDYTSSTWVRQHDKASVALEIAKGATTFAVPTCMLHGSKSVRSLRTKLIAALGFFIMFYPMLYYLLEINLALNYSRPLTPPLIGLLITTTLFVILLIYGLFPRALERAIRFDDVSRIKDSVLLSLSNSEYQSLFLELNEMVTDLVTVESVETDD